MIELILLIIMQIESSNGVHLASPKGAKGPMQLMPIGAREVEAVYGYRCDLNDFKSNIKCGSLLYRFYLKRVNYNLKESLVLYNGGYRALKRYCEGRPFKESKDYVDKFCALLDCDEVQRQLDEEKK